MVDSDLLGALAPQPALNLAEDCALFNGNQRAEDFMEERESGSPPTEEPVRRSWVAPVFERTPLEDAMSGGPLSSGIPDSMTTYHS